MLGLFVALGIAILTLLAILLWFVPHLLQQHALRVANESAQLREMISEMISEQEVVAMRQVQLGTSISYLQDQLEQLATLGLQGEGYGRPMLTTLEPDALQVLETRMTNLQLQIDRYVTIARTADRQENESWMYLLSLLAAIQDRIRTLSEAQSCSVGSIHADSH